MRPRRVLLVDDDADFAALLAEGLEARGHKVERASNGAAAIALAAHQPDVMLVDIVLPDRNGYTLARELRALAPRALIMGITAFANPPTREQLGSGIACMFLKPVETLDIARLIEGWQPPP